MRLPHALRTLCLCALVLCGGCGIQPAMRLQATTGPSVPGTYQNPLQIAMPLGHNIESCADPAVIRSRTPGDSDWYLYCTGDPAYEGSEYHWISISRSSDLVHWTYVTDVFQSRPEWISKGGGAWAPEIQWFNGQYYLYYTVSKTDISPGGSAIFVATSPTPTGPWKAYAEPVIEPQGPDRWVYDPAIASSDGRRYIIYGSFGGGIALRELSGDGLHSLRETEIPLTTSDRYEGAYIVRRNGFYYLMMSASDCCRGPLTGYAIFAARSRNITGPYVDADGVSTLDSRVGGTPVLAMNGNRWLGTGHHTIATDDRGQDWIIYHAVDINQPYFNGRITRRPALMDRLDWVNEWPMVRHGAGASDSAQCAPWVAGGPHSCSETTTPATVDEPGQLIDATDFDQPTLPPAWTWVRPPRNGGVEAASGWLQFPTQDAELQQGAKPASILSRPAPAGNFMVETRISTNVPRSGSLPHVQGGLLVFKDDANYVKLVEVAIGATRQLEFGKRLGPVANGYPSYGTSVLASPGETTYLRIVRRITPETGAGREETYTAYSSHDGVTWRKGSTWRHALGDQARIGLVSMGGAGYATSFEYVRIYALK